MSICTDCKVVCGKFIICDIGLAIQNKINWTELNENSIFPRETTCTPFSVLTVKTESHRHVPHHHKHERTHCVRPHLVQSQHVEVADVVLLGVSDPGPALLLVNHLPDVLAHKLALEAKRHSTSFGPRFKPPPPITATAQPMRGGVTFLMSWAQRIPQPRDSVLKISTWLYWRLLNAWLRQRSPAGQTCGAIQPLWAQRCLFFNGALPWISAVSAVYRNGPKPFIALIAPFFSRQTAYRRQMFPSGSLVENQS